MTKFRSSRFSETVIVFAVCVGAAVLGFAMGKTHTVTAINSRPPSQTPDQKSTPDDKSAPDVKTIERKEFPNEPFRLSDLKVKKERITLNRKFSA